MASHSGTLQANDAHVTARDVTLAYGDHVVLRDLNFQVRRGNILVLMGGSGCGKSTLLRHLIGLQRPARGTVEIDGRSYFDVPPDEQRELRRRSGVLFQSGALWSSLTLAENVSLPLTQFTDLAPAEVREVACYKLALVGLAGFEDFYPAEISGGMKKRAGLARAMALDPDLLFFDEPSAGLDPISSRRLDELILELRASLGATIVVVTHELASIFTIATDGLFLDAASKTMIALGPPKELLASGPPAVRAFLSRGETPEPIPGAPGPPRRP